VNNLRIGVIGTGHLGRIHAKLIREVPHAELTWVVDREQQARQALAREYHVSDCGDYLECVDEIDAAIVATPTGSHYQIVLDLLNRGIHTLVEKPMTLSTAEADELVQLAVDRNAVLQVGHVERFNPVFEQVRNHSSQPRFIQATRASGYSFRSTDIGVVLDLMIHDIDLVLSLAQSDVIDVRATGSVVIGPHEDIAEARLEFANGCVANLGASRISHQAERSMQIFSSEGYFGLDFSTGKLTRIKPSAEVVSGTHQFGQMNADQQARAREEMFTRYFPVEEIEVQRQNAILQEQKNFIHCITTGATPRVSGKHGRDAVAVSEQIVALIAASNMPQTIPFDARPEIIRRAA
jgi:predicted dehydrogenase